MLNIILPYRNRDFKRVEYLLNSLQQQTSKDFKLFFIDYGSFPDHAAKIKSLCDRYSFVDYKFHPVADQPWNKSRALNSKIKELDAAEYCFIADADLIFHSEFIQKACQLQEKGRAVYFQVGFLNRKQDISDINFKTFRNYRKSTYEATGLSMFPVSILNEINGFDEFYHFWGAEDTDIHVRLKNAGKKIDFFSERILMLHQWHSSYRSAESSKLSAALQVKDIVKLNSQHLNSAIQSKNTRVNFSGWGTIMNAEELKRLEKHEINLVLENNIVQIDELVYGQLPSISDKILKVRIKKAARTILLKNRTKQILKKNYDSFYTMKQVNDLLLLNIISFYRDYPYYFKVLNSGDEIEFAINFNEKHS